MFPAGAGQGCGRDWHRTCGYTIVGAWGVGTDRDLGVRPAWPARRTEGADSEGSPLPCQCPASQGRLCHLGGTRHVRLQSPEGELRPLARSRDGVLGTALFLFPSFLSACSLSAPSQPLALPAPLAWGLPGLHRLPPSLLSLLLYFSVFRCQSTWKS